MKADHTRHHSSNEVAAFALPLLRGEPLPDVPDARAREIARGLLRAGLTGLALHLVRGKPAAPALVAALEEERNRLRADLALLYDRMGRFSAMLEAAGVRFIVLKGGSLAPILYDAPDHRPMVDVDVLIRREQWPAVKEALSRASFHLPKPEDERYWLANYFNLAVSSPDPRPASFDIHWALNQEVRYRVDEAGLWERAVPLVWEGKRYLRLGNEDLLLSLLLHLAHHYFDARLIWLYDIRLVCARLPLQWEAVFRRARAWGMATVCGLGLAFVEKVLPGSIPVEALRATCPGPLRRLLLAPLRSSSPARLFVGDDLRAFQLLQGILVIDSPADALRFSAGKIARRLRFLGARPRLR